ncbi:MAG: hypothetical protein Q9168_005366 [Polycauliona sp. 1 TL-2023]
MAAMSQLPQHPERLGQRLLPTLIDQIAADDPTRTFVSLTKSIDIQQGFHDVDYATFAAAINRCAHWLDQELGRPRYDFEKIAYIGPSDLRYAIFLIAAVKAGYVAMLPSPRTSLQDHSSLLAAADCQTIVAPESRMPIVDSLIATRSMKSATIPAIDWFLNSTTAEVKSYPYSKTFEQAQSEPFVTMHTSGSTGPPKLVVSSHGSFATLDAFLAIPSLGGQPVSAHLLIGKRMFSPFPLFHSAALGIVLACNIYAGMTIVMPPPAPLTADLCDLIHIHASLDGTCLPPSILVDISHNPDYMDRLRKMDFVCYGGGPLPKGVGDRIAASGKPLLNYIGATETNLLPTEVLDAEDWEYIKYSPFLGHEFREVGDGLAELVIVRDETLSHFQAVFSSFPDLQEYPMKDTYERHPTKPDLWRFTGRTDDIIVFSNGEKFNPLVMEGMIMDHPAVKSALVIGQARFQTALLVEPAATAITSAGSFIDEIWPTIQKSNRLCATQGSIAKEFILVTSPDKPMLRASKGTVQRKSTLQLYATELDILYSTDGSSITDGLGLHLDFDNRAQLTATLRTLVSDSLNQEHVDDHQDLMQLGLNSLQALSLTKRINNLLQKHEKSITTATIFASASVANLAEALEKLGLDNDQPNGGLSEVSKQYKQMDMLLERYTPHLADRRPATRVIVLTGSTGSLGSYLLSSLIADPTVSKIYCLNRSPQSSHRQEISHKHKGLSTDFQKVQFLQWNPSQPHLGLDQTTGYQALLEETTDVVHNAWEVNFNLSLQSFEPHLAGVQQLIEFSQASARRAHIFFISTVGTVLDHESNQPNIPETPMMQWSSAQTSGYPQSKLIAERLLVNAFESYHVPVTICRIGQIAGPTKREGIWPKQEWIPSLMASAQHLRSIPDSLGPLDAVDWIPVDLVADIVGELLSSSNRQADVSHVGEECAENRKEQASAKPNVFHIVNPRRTTWQDILPSIIQHQSSEIQSTNYTTWLDALRQSLEKDSESVDDNPAIKLLPFFENIERMMKSGKGPVLLDTRRTEAMSQTMRLLQPVGSQWMENWLRQWETQNDGHETGLANGKV